MFEILMDHMQEFSLYTVYVSYALSLLLLISCYWVFFKTIKHRNYKFHNLRISLPKEKVFLKTSNDQSYYWWLPKVIRRKISPPEDPDSAMILLEN